MFTIALAGASALASVASVDAIAAQSDPFAASVPNFETAASKAADFRAGGHGVAEQSGTASYRFPIVVPPGRNGMAPELSLQYSSSGELRSGLAVGWIIGGLPTIERDPRYPTKLEYKSSYCSGSGRLIAVPDIAMKGGKTYRCEFDDSFIRFERVSVFGFSGKAWIVRTTDGRTRYFELSQSNRASDGATRWNLTKAHDPFGNTVKYSWHPVTTGESADAYRGYGLTSIRWSSNDNAGLKAYAKVQFEYIDRPERCPGSSIRIGASIDHLFGQRRLHGGERLTKIVVSVRDTQSAEFRRRREIALGYDETALGCTQDVSPLRYLTQIDEIGISKAGKATALPPVRFEYGKAGQLFDQKVELATTGFGGVGDTDGAKSRLIDLTGDGIVDWVSVREVAAAGQMTRCQLHVKPGKRGGGYTQAGAFSMWLPTATWNSGFLSTVKESCTINGQFVFREHPTTKNCKSAPGSFISYHFLDYDGDGVTDLLTNAWTDGLYHPATDAPGVAARQGQAHRDAIRRLPKSSGGTPSGGGVSPSGGAHLGICIGANGDPYTCPTPPCEPAWSRKPEEGGVQNAQKLWVWRVYKGDGKAFAGAAPGDLRSPQVVLSPRPMPASVDDLGLRAGVPASTPQTLIDINGDGALDVVSTVWNGDKPQPLGRHPELWIWRGDGSGAFGTKESWPLPLFTPKLDTSRTWNDSEGHHWQNAVAATLRDLNSDGLPDLLVQLAAPATAHVLWNKGNGFTSPKALGLNTPLELSQSDLASDGSRTRRSLISMIDVDGDGLVDRVRLPQRAPTATDPTDSVTEPPLPPQLSLNVGDHFLAERNLPLVWRNAIQLRQGRASGWKQFTEVIDANGDGIADLVRWTSAGALQIFSQNVKEHGAPRKLRHIDNGRGLTVHFVYAPSSDFPTNVSRAPTVRWVLQEATVTPGYGQPSLTTRYRYANPVYESPTADRHEQFLGFRQVTVKRPSPDGVLPGGRIVRTYRYTRTEDGRGYMKSEARYVATNATSPRTLESYLTFRRHKRPIFGGLVSFTHLSRSVTYTCNEGLPESSHPGCDEEFNGLHVTKQNWQPWISPVGFKNLQVKGPTTPVPKTPAPDTAKGSPSDTSAVPASLYLLRDVLQEQSLAQITSGDKRELTEYQVRYDQPIYRKGEYRVLSRRTETQGARLGDFGVVFTTTSRQENHYGRMTGLALQTKRWLTSERIATTKRGFYESTGTLRSLTKPEQNGFGKKTRYRYDTHRLFLTETKNELGHVVKTTYDPGTGGILTRLGPDTKVGSFPDCEPSTPDPVPCWDIVWNAERWTRDGFGRVIARHTSVDHPTLGYESKLAATTRYHDAPVALLKNIFPTRIIKKEIQDFPQGDATTVWITSEQQFDGLGRTIHLMDHRQVDGEVNAATSYEYDAGGNLRAVHVPDPQLDDGSRVAYRYTHDGLGRLLTFRRPDNTGVDLTYRPREKQVAEVTTDGSGSVTKGQYDAFGRLIAVHEKNDPDAPTPWAITGYAHDDHDRLRTVVDAENNWTYIDHDWAGNRTAITRGTRTWTYHYDLNGNIDAKTPPAPAGSDPAAYVTAYQHDPLDRVKLRTPATMGRTDAQMAELGIGKTSYTYDDGDNSVGRLSHVFLKPFGTVAYQYSADGLITREQRTVDVTSPSPVSASQTVEREFNAMGQQTLVRHDNGDWWRVRYDPRGLVKTIEWRQNPTTNSWRQVADYNRSIAGAPRVRRTQFNQRRRWSYDPLGRPTDDRVEVGETTFVPVTTRSYAFSDSGDLTAVTGTPSTVTATYTYDARHRLKTAQGPAGYAASFRYSDAGNVRRADVGWPGSSSTRAVTYEYGSAEPHAVDRLMRLPDPNGNAAVYAAFQYDMAGNMTRRIVTAGEQWKYEWDGESQLRQASRYTNEDAPACAIDCETYYYDQDGNRMLAFHPSTGVRFWFGNSETHFSPTGLVRKRYVHIADTGGPLARITNSSVIELQYSDALQNLMLSLGSSGEQVASFAYGSFGEIVSSTGADQHRRQFNGKEHDRVTGLRYYGARYYDPLTLRWNAGDPLSRFAPEVSLTSPQGHNLYHFSLNNPLRFFDPDGRNADDREQILALHRAFLRRQRAKQKKVIKVKKAKKKDIKEPPKKRGNAPIGKDGHPIELHHPKQTPKRVREESTRTKHRGKGNYKKNHKNTGRKRSKIDRKKSKSEHRNYWKNQWDLGAWDRMRTAPKITKKAAETAARLAKEYDKVIKKIACPKCDVTMKRLRQELAKMKKLHGK